MKKREILRIGDLSVDLDTRQVHRDGQEIQLGRLSFDLLEVLIREAPSALSSDEIVQRVWSGDIVSDETVKQRVSLLRRALGRAPSGEYVETLRGYGYRLGLPVEGTTESEPDVPLSQSGPGRLMRTIILILAIISLILLITVLATVVRQVKRLSDGGGSDPCAIISAPVSNDSVQEWAGDPDHGRCLSRFEEYEDAKPTVPVQRVSLDDQLRSGGIADLRQESHLDER